MIRRDRRVHRAVSADVLEFDPDMVLRLSRKTEAELFGEEPDLRRQMLLRAMRLAWQQELTKRQRIYLDHYYHDAMTMQAIADTYGVNVSTVSRTLRRARNRLRHVLQYYII